MAWLFDIYFSWLRAEPFLLRLIMEPLLYRHSFSILVLIWRVKMCINANMFAIIHQIDTIIQKKERKMWVVTTVMPRYEKKTLPKISLHCGLQVWNLRFLMTFLTSITRVKMLALITYLHLLSISSYLNTAANPYLRWHPLSIQSVTRFLVPFLLRRQMEM